MILGCKEFKQLLSLLKIFLYKVTLANPDHFRCEFSDVSPFASLLQAKRWAVLNLYVLSPKTILPSYEF